MKKLIKHLRKHWKVHACWIVFIVVMVTSYLVVWSLKDNRSLRELLKDREQVLRQCEETNNVWTNQIESGSVKIIKEDGTIERWEMKRDFQIGDEVGK